MKVKTVVRATENKFYLFEDSQVLELYNHFSVRKISGFMDRSAMERRTQDLLDARGLMIYHENNGAAVKEVAGIWLYRAESHPDNVQSLGHVHRDSNRIIRLLIDVNPKRGKSRERFALYRDGMTVYEYRMACRAKLGGDAYTTAENDLKHDVGKGFIRIEYDATQELSEQAAELLSQRSGG